MILNRRINESVNTENQLCDKCGFEPVIRFGNSHTELQYQCPLCNFNKWKKNINLGIVYRIDKYSSLNVEYSAKDLRYRNEKILEDELKDIDDKDTQKIKRIWNKYIDYNIVDIMKLAPLSKYKNFGSKYKDYKHDPATHILPVVRKLKKNYIHINYISQPHNTNHKFYKNLKYVLRKAYKVIWIGKKTKAWEIIYDECVKMYKELITIQDIKDIPKMIDIIGCEPIFITGASMGLAIDETIKHKNDLDKKVFTYLNSLDRHLHAVGALDYIITMGNTGVERSVAKWCVENERYVLLNMFTTTRKRMQHHDKYKLIGKILNG